MHAHCLSAALAVAALVRDAALEPPAVGMHADTPTVDVDMSTVTNFAILSQARSGSTWLNTMLNGHPRILSYGEYLSEYAGANRDNDGLVCKPLQRLAEFRDAANLLECHEWNYDDKRVWANASQSGPVALGFKWFNNQGGWDLDYARHRGEKCPKTGCRMCKEPSEFIGWLREHRAKLIVLVRDASLSHFISEVKHDESGKFQCQDSACAEGTASEKVFVDLDRLRRWLRYTEDYWTMMRQFSKDVGTERYILSYEQLSKDPEGYAKKLFSFLGLEPVTVSTEQTLKMGGTRMRDSIENANEVAEALRGTPYEGQVDAIDDTH